MKYKYPLQELNSVGLSLGDVTLIVDKAHKKYNADKAPKDDDTEKAYLLYRYIQDNNLTRLHDCLDYVFANNLWSAWRRGQSTFKDLIRENAEEKRRKIEEECARRKVANYDENYPLF